MKAQKSAPHRNALNANALALLSSWYEKTSRPLAWRKKNPDPYEVWISEVMSQQSTMATVVPYWTKWMKLFPTRKALALSGVEEVQAAWAFLV